MRLIATLHPPYQTVLPFWYDLNSEYWSNILTIWAGFVELGAFIAYDVFYLGWVVVLIYQNERDVLLTQVLLHPLFIEHYFLHLHLFKQ